MNAGYFRVLGMSPALGRDFQASDDVFHGPRVVILSNGLWQRRFGGDRGIIGHGVTLDGDSYEVIGVMPRGLLGARLAGHEGGSDGGATVRMKAIGYQCEARSPADSLQTKVE